MVALAQRRFFSNLGYFGAMLLLLVSRTHGFVTRTSVAWCRHSSSFAALGHELVCKYQSAPSVDLQAAHILQQRGFRSTKETTAGRRTRLNGRKSSTVDDGSGLYRADRVLANRSGKPRSECFSLLKMRRVWQKMPSTPNHKGANSTMENVLEVVAGPAARIRMNSELLIDKVHAVPLPPPLVLVYHKPKWVLSVRSDPKGRPCLDDSILPAQMHAVGRLDYDSSGLLLWSSSGPLTQRLLHPKHHITKEYEATVVGEVDYEQLRKQLTQGVAVVNDGEKVFHTAKLLHVHHLPSDEVQAYLDDIRANLPCEYNQTDLEQRGYMDDLLYKPGKQLSKVWLTVQEGKYRMVRRMLANCGHGVIRLHRHCLGKIRLDETLTPPGESRALTSEEFKWVQSLLRAPVKSEQKANKTKKDPTKVTSLEQQNG